LSAMFPNSSQVKALHSNTLQIMRQENGRKMTQLIKQAGQNSPDIKLPNTDGKEVSLSSMRGKYVLVQFWAGQDRDSRVMNPVLVANYRKYHPKGFDIYQVSIDTSRTAWLNAIKADHLDWTNVGDMEGSVQAVRNYNIQSIPSNYLLGKDGSILAKNLMGPALNNALQKYLK
jgi:peroxiredoxin